MPSAIRVIDQASEIVATTGNFDGVLSGSDSDVQAALETIDEISKGLTFSGDIVLDDGSFDSPSLKFVGGSNDDEALIYLNNSLDAGKSDLDIMLVGDTTDAKLQIRNASDVIQVRFTAIGEAIFNEQGNDADFRVEAVGEAKALLVNGSNGYVGVGLTPTANMAGLSIEEGLLSLKERTTPTADANYGKIYTKTNNRLYYQDGAGVEHEIANAPF